jgi:RNA polymerase sigma factor (TIGR02999 family)
MQITVLLQRVRVGDREALKDVIPLVYEELKNLARSHLRREMGVVSLETTALVHEAYLKLSAGRHPDYENRSHFFGIASRLMRQVLVDGARARSAEKRLAAQEVSLADLPEWGARPDRSLLEIDDALRRLEQVSPLKCRLIKMRYFGGMTADESAAVVTKPVHVVRRELRLAKAWLRRELSAKPQAAFDNAEG